MFKLRYIGETCASLLNNKIYECIGEENGHFRVIDEEGYDEYEEIQGYLYPKRFFEIIDG